MRILIFDPIISGHHLEYLHHLYMMAVEHKEHEFVFVVHRDFEQRRALMDWPESKNISFDFLPPFSEQANNSTIELLKTSWRLCKLLDKYVKKHQANKVFTNNLISFVPFVPLFLGRGVSVSGIIYSIYLYNVQNFSKFQRRLNVFKYQVMARSRSFGTVLILNDPESADILNHKYKCDKFVGLPDPFVPIMAEKTVDFRKEYNIPSSASIFAHFGGLSKRKGTLDIMKSIRLVDETSRRNYWFVFAGVVYDDIKEIFYQMYDELKDNYHIIVRDEFCSYEYLASLCQACNAIIAPYHKTDLSSGMFGYASQFGKPLISPSQGLVGKIVEQYGLGLKINSINEEMLCEAYGKVANEKMEVTKDYTLKNNVRSFQRVISNFMFA